MNSTQNTNSITQSVIYIVVICSLWSIIIFFIGEGWFGAAVNIFFLLFTGAATVPLKLALTERMGNLLAWIVTIFVFFLGVVILRSIEFEILDVLFS